MRDILEAELTLEAQRRASERPLVSALGLSEALLAEANRQLDAQRLRREERIRIAPGRNHWRE